MKRILSMLPAATVLASLVLGAPVQACGGTEKVRLEFYSFDGGGPDFEALPDAPIISLKKVKSYHNPDHDRLLGAGFSVIFTITGLKPGETGLTVHQRAPILGLNKDLTYAVRVDDDLDVHVRKVSEKSLAKRAPVPFLVIEVNGRTFYAPMEDNSSARALAEKLNAGPMEVRMNDHGGFEKVGPLPWSLERNDEKVTAGPGDVILYQGNKITLYYDENTWDLTRLAKIDGITREEMEEVLGKGGVTASFRVEYHD